MNNTPNNTKPSRRRLKFILGFIITPMVTLIVLALLGQFIAINLPGINLQQWFHETRIMWFFVRLGLYALTIGLMFSIDKKSKAGLPKITKWSIIATLIFAEAVSQIALA